MALPAPLLDRRDLDTILHEARALAPFYTPEWAAAEDGSAGAALLTIFAKLVEGLVRRLNEVPQKNFIAFLNMLGVKLLPAQPARVPLTFSLSTGAQEAVTIPARSQAAATPPDGGDPVVFETEQDIVATPAQLLAVVSVVLARDAIVDHTEDVLAGVSTELFADTGRDLQEHSLYMAHSDLFDLKAEATLTLQLVIRDAGLTQAHFTDHLSWEWWHGDHWVPSTVPAFHDMHHVFTAVTTLSTALPQAAVDTIPVRTDVANDARFPDTGLLLIGDEIVSYTGKASNTFIGVTRGVGARGIPGASGLVAHDAGTEVRAIDPPFAVSTSVSTSQAGQARVRVTLRKTFLAELSTTTVAGTESRWIRCRTLRRPLLQDSSLLNLTIDTVRVGTAVAQGILPDALFTNDIPLDFSAQVYPFGSRPRTTDTFYIASDDALSKRGLRIRLAFEISLGGTTEADIDTEPPPAELVLSWEYWNGTGWQVITQRQDQTDRLSKSGEVSFPCPQDIASTSVNGQQHYWIRVRIVSGDYGRERFTFDPEKHLIEPDYGQIRPPILQRLTIRYGADPEQQEDSDLKTLDYCLTFNNLTFTDRTREAQQTSDLFQPFQPPEQAEQALYLGFDPAPVKGPISLFFDLEAQAYTEGNRPRLVWEYLRQPSGTTPSAWTRLAVVDGTRHLTESGTIAFIGPPDFAREGRFGRPLHWIRATNLAPIFQPQPQPAAAAPVPLVAAVPVAAGQRQIQPCPQLLASFHPAFAPPQSAAPPAPRVQGIYPNTVLASQAETIQNEILGSSRGVANQTFTLAAFPVIAEQLWVNELATLSEGERAVLTARDDVEVDDIKDDQGTTIAFWVRWQPVDDLTEAQAADRVYSIDRTFGQVQFGDGSHGMVPPAGRDNLQVTYQAGGGVRGNVAAGLITALRTTIPFVDRVVNRVAAGGGSDTEPLDRALERGPQMIKHRGRTVTAEDFEWLTREASQAVARVKVLPTFNDQGQFATGWVTVIIVPESPDARPFPSPQLRAQVEQYLRDRAANLVAFPRHVQVTGPTYVAVDVEAELIPTQIQLAPQVEAAALQRLRQFLHPLTGGYLNRGWEFGRLPCLSDFYALLEDIGGVDHVGHLSMTLRAVTPTGTTVGEPQRVTEAEPLAVTMPEHTLIYGETLTITVKA